MLAHLDIHVGERAVLGHFLLELFRSPAALGGEHGDPTVQFGFIDIHILLGRDMLREAAADVPELDPELLLRLDHIIVSHQNLPEWGSPIAPHTPEALLVHYADDIDAKFQMVAAALTEPAADDATEFTSRNNPLRRAIFRGLRE